MDRLAGAGELIDALDALSKSAEQPADPPAEDEYAVVTKTSEKRVTVGIMYPADTVDAHGEYADASDLEDAVYDYVQNGDLALRKQHGREVIGHIVGIMPWPFEVEAEVKQMGGAVAKSQKVKLPAGTVFAAARWTPEAWKDVKAGRIAGFSMGGRAMRLKERSGEDRSTD